MRWVTLVLVVLFVSAVSVLSWAQGAGKKSTYAVERMTCGDCLSVISTGVAHVAEKARVTGDYSGGVVVVMHDAGTSPEAVGRAITRSGYPARLTETVEATPEEMTAVTGEPVRKIEGSCCTAMSRPACGGSGESWRALYMKLKGWWAR
ncbi:heavy-metal-associated domain-containing protein [Desulfoluna butyratoxydans]|uniref:Heavy metal-associated domain hma n=1 Tax=Desulfoluna butyratoxydans TaxID=231438 RepID=A0A4U8YQ20_9BACT|nr:heavy-metal-associated domain-containing protein [Desulfoluna butyratoxydans]VFQ45814.1 heavy metal-associated domain hma [Desulfoluna butyratoxydans]